MGQLQVVPTLHIHYKPLREIQTQRPRVSLCYIAALSQFTQYTEDPPPAQALEAMGGMLYPG